MADRRGRPLAFHLTVGEAADCKAYDTLIALPERVPQAFLADKGYDADAIRADLANRNIEAVMPGRSNRRVKIEYDRSL
ncbi:transposase [Altererythrobacter sp. KTW20L]|uniref:transposase n=1 Tax=Altererythrobacter sp. KTW20L TaxID=2942210 RepID=UPI0020BE540D|nr:transposase [Altererythrobacter sp. KTW20L]MCL6252360.1 transposase [Altererythrobacter sp. KTW20L]